MRRPLTYRPFADLAKAVKASEPAKTSDCPPAAPIGVKVVGEKKTTKTKTRCFKKKKSAERFRRRMIADRLKALLN